MKKVWNFIIFYALIPFAASLLVFGVNLTGIPIWINLIAVPPAVALICFLFRKKLNFSAGLRISGGVLLGLSIVFAVMMVFAEGNTEGTVMLNFCWLIFPYAPVMFILVLMNKVIMAFGVAFLSYLAEWLFCLHETGRHEFRKFILPSAVVILCIGVSVGMYLNRPSVRYSGHGFEYMHGYSSTDFTDYTVYAGNSKLVTLDHEPSFVIENEEDMPVLDGAEACYPLYAAFAKAVYRNIDQIEQRELDTDYRYYNGRIVSFTNTIVGFERLIRGGKDEDKFGGGADMFFGARPSESQLQEAREFGVEIEVTPIGREAFVFFVEDDNPVEGLDSTEIREIYHGDIVNWADLGGKNQKITAFQRPENSGSQTMMTYFMGDVSLKEPETYEQVDAMSGVIHKVAQYANEAGAIGYTFRYFLEELNQETGVKMLEVDGVYPTVENIENGTYPLTVDLCLITRKDDPNPNVQKMKEFILSEDGQTIIRRTGYAANPA